METATEHNFKPGDRLRSLRSGRIWIVVDAVNDPPFADWNDRVAVRDPNWNVTNYIWMTPNVFEKAYDI